MTIVRSGRLLAGLALALLPTGVLAAPRGSGTLLVAVANVRNGHGKVHVDVCPQAMFLKEDCPFSSEVPAHTGVTQITIRGLPAGAYALQATHDENGNGKVDRGLFGIPKEGVGFSRDAPARFSAPRWNDAVIVFNGRSGATTLHMRYYLGPSGPPAGSR